METNDSVLREENSAPPEIPRRYDPSSAKSVLDFFLRLGRYLFAISIGAFALQYFVYAHRPQDLMNIPPYTIVHSISAYFAGAALLITALSIGSGIRAALSSRILGAGLLLDFLIFHAARLLHNLQNGNIRTRAFETLAIAGVSFVLGATFSREKSGFSTAPLDATENFGVLLVAISLAIFGAQHFMYHAYIASLIPSWIPARTFLAYFTGAAFLAAALSFVTRKVARLAGILLALMFLIWIAVLHAPLVAHSPHNGNLWSSLFVAVAMAGSGLILAESFPPKTE